MRLTFFRLWWIFILCVIGIARTNNFQAGGNISNPLRSMNSSFNDKIDYQSLQGFSSAVKDLNQSYASLNYGDDNNIRFAVLEKFFSSFIKLLMFSVVNLIKNFTFNFREKSVSVLQRLTPRKFQSLHGFVRLNNGIMATIDTDVGRTVRLENMLVHDNTRRLYQAFPGPLVRGLSHKKTVIKFCEDKLKQDQLTVSHRASYCLLWSYLILMLRQNGNYSEGDIAELLMKNSEDFKTKLETSEELKKTMNDTTDCESEDNVASEKNSNTASQSQEETTASEMTETVVLHKFRDYLLCGNINDALDFATDNNLWGHALFLASKVDRRQHANVMLKFANKLPYNDPLQTLYQIMSGRMPACVTNIDDKWGDWRPHLAMIISNCTDKPELVKRSILALGDSLASHGDIFASQFCYLLVEPNFAEYAEEGKIALLGTSSHKQFKDFLSDDAIIMSEVYEYARSLSEENFFIPSLQKYKFLLAANMLDHGMQLKCLLYMEQIAKSIMSDPKAFQINFIAKVYTLADRLKFYDPVMEKSYEDNFNNNALERVEDQKWLQDLSALLQNCYEPAWESTQHSGNEPLMHQPYQESYDPISKQQTPMHFPSNEEQQSEPPISQVVPDQSQMLNQHDNQPDNTYLYDYNDSAAVQQYSDQSLYDANAQSNYQQQQMTDYGYGWDQVG